MAADDAAGDAENGSRFGRLAGDRGAGESDFDEDAFRQDAGADADQLVRRLGEGLLGVHEQVQEDLLELAFGAEDGKRLAGGQVADADAGGLQSPSRNSRR